MCVVRITTQLLYPQPTVSWVSPTAGLDVVAKPKKSLHISGTEPVSSSPYPKCREINYQIQDTCLMFVDPRITVQFMKKNPTRCNNVSKYYYSTFI
jgi:hypothetical protein